MLQAVLILLVAIGAAAVTALWAWIDHVRTHPQAVRPLLAVERFVGWWERLMIRAARSVPALRHPSD